jgi:hypothetical protein
LILDQTSNLGEGYPLSLGAAIVVSVLFVLDSAWITSRAIKLWAFFFSTMVSAAV